MKTKNLKKHLIRLESKKVKTDGDLLAIKSVKDTIKTIENNQKIINNL